MQAKRRATQEVYTLVHGVALNCWEAEFLDKLLPKILHVDLLGADFQRLLLGRFKILCS